MDPGQTLLLVDIASCDGAITIRSVWATTRDRRAGPRRTDVETLADRSALMRRLPELVAALCRWPDPPGRQICLGTNPGGHCGLEPPDAVAAAAPELAAAAG